MSTPGTNIVPLCGLERDEHPPKIRQVDGERQIATERNRGWLRELDLGYANRVPFDPGVELAQREERWAAPQVVRISLSS